MKKATEDKFPQLASSHSILYSNDLTANQNSTSNLAELESIIISAQANRDTRILDDSSFDINSNIGNLTPNDPFTLDGQGLTPNLTIFSPLTLVLFHSHFTPIYPHCIPIYPYFIPNLPVFHPNLPSIYLNFIPI